MTLQDPNSVPDFTTMHFSNNLECLHCHSQDDSDTEKRRFWHVMRYCNEYHWGPSKTCIVKK